jgi:NAD(P)-dependent dehydrogenase (short-subunit alcohol dehydrogenase family)
VENVIDLSGKTAVVTGGSRGIGRAVALALAGQGAFVVIADRSDWKAGDESTTAEILRLGGQATSKNLDVSDAAEVDRTMAEIDQEHSGIDILVNNAGVLTAGSVLETSNDQWRHQFAVNVDGTFFCMRAGIRSMRAHGRGGKVINVTSISGLRANPGFAAYCSSKAAIVNLTRQAGIDYGAEGINVNSVAPGFVETDMTAIYDSPTRRALEAQTPNGRWAMPKQIADAVLFLASPLADHICGEVLAVDGGWLVGTPVRIESD